MGIIFEVIDKFGKRIRLTNKQYRHIKKHPRLHDSAEILKSTIQSPAAIRYNEYDLLTI